MPKTINVNIIVAMTSFCVSSISFPPGLNAETLENNVGVGYGVMGGGGVVVGVVVGGGVVSVGVSPSLTFRLIILDSSEYVLPRVSSQ